MILEATAASAAGAAMAIVTDDRTSVALLTIHTPPASGGVSGADADTAVDMATDVTAGGSAVSTDDVTDGTMTVDQGRADPATGMATGIADAPAASARGAVAVETGDDVPVV